MKYCFFACLIFMIGCASVKYFSSEAEKLYYEKCNGCHRVYQKSEYNTHEWKMKMDEMSKRAKLSDEEKRMVLLYLTE